MRTRKFSKTLKVFMAQACLLGLAQLAQAQNKVVAYVPNWVNLNTYSNQIDYAKLTHINIAFENPVNAAGDLSFNSTNNVLITKAHANNLKVLISIGGGSASGDATLLARYASLTNNTNRAAFVAKLAAYVTAHNFDGLDVDLEGPNINGDYGAFIAALSGALKPQGKLLTAALSQGYGGGSVPNSVFQYFDFVNIMAYDGAGYWDPNAPGQHSSLDFAKSNTQYWLNRGLPKSKAVLGVPFYGYGFGAAFLQRDYPYSTICAQYPGAENVDKIGNTIWYNGIPTIKAKTNYAFDQGIAGMMIWSLDYDVPGAKSLLTAIDDVFKARTNVTPVPQAPYTGTPIAIPGKVQAENYDLGGQGVSFNDITAANEGSTYRTDAVDVQATTDTDGGYNVGYIADGEWLEYTVNVAATDAYNIAFRTASAGGTVRLEVDGSDVTGPVTLPVTGAYQTWATTTKSNVTLTAGQHILRVFVVTGGFNLNYVNITAMPPVVQAPYSGTAISLPGKFEAENYDLGGEGLAYHDLEAANQGASYRTDGVDVQASTDAGAGYNVAYTADGEWLEYTVNVATAGTYDVGFRTAGTGAGVVRLEVDGSDVTGAVTLPNTGAWQTWATTTKSGVAFTAGQHIVRVFVVTGGFNLNYVTVSTPVADNGPGFLHASGKNIVNNSGNFIIKAMNLGNYMVQEGYMLNLGGGYQHNIKNKIADVVGTAARDQFYKDYLNNYITKADIDSIAKWGFNTVRLPIHYNLFTPLGQPDVFLEEGFTMVDNIISWCKANNIYVVIDLHAAPGGQSSGDISDYVSGQPSLWESQANRDQTVKLWKKIAQRYANEQYVGAYDLINETNWTLANNNALLAELMKNITTAIRQVDNNHLVFIEGNSYANDYNGLTPKWDNNMAYSFHKYWNDNTDASLNFIFAVRDGQNVPVWLGEFGENSNHWIAETVTLLNKYNIGWAIWPYKKMGSISGASSFKEPANWSALSGYINGGTKPSAAVGQAILNELIENIKAKNNTTNKGYVYALISQPGNNNTAPYANVTLPGKITAAHYDMGKQGYAYSDAVYQTAQYGSGGGTYTDWNTGWYYRNDGVDLQFSSAENGPTVGWTADNEWLQYTVTVATSGAYTVKVRVAGNGGKLSLASDGTTLINAATVAATGAWTTWQTLTLGTVNLTAGTHKLKFTFNTAGFNISNFEFSTSAPVNQLPTVSISSPTNGTSLIGPATVNIAASAADVDGTVSKVEFFNGTTLLGTATAAPYTFSWTNVAIGIYTVTAQATDNSGAVATSGAVTVNVTTETPINQVPTVSIASPANNATFTSPATVNIGANAADVDGSVAKVEFFNGATKLGEDATSPYSYSWTNVAAGTYTITVKATDNSGAVTTSSAVTVKVNAPVATCTAPTYVELTGNYVAGSKVQKGGKLYECRPWPNSGWCNGAAWAYGPGTGTAWADAWIDRGTCNARVEESDEAVSVLLIPNPASSTVKVAIKGDDATAYTIQVIDLFGNEVLRKDDFHSGNELDISNLKSAMYLVLINGGQSQKLVKE